jgi:hypothetical protein
MHYSIYIPKVSGANTRHLVPIGLGDLIQSGDATPDFSEVMDKGPDGSHGMYLSWPGSEPAYRPGQLTWQPAKPDKTAGLPAGRYWWGIDPANPVTSDDLIRQTTLRGKPVRAGSSFWLIPNLMLLPHEFDCDDKGEEIRVPIQEYSAVADKCRWCFEAIKSHIETGVALPERELRAYTIQMLTKNYRLFRELAWHLRLLNDDNWLSLAGQTVDFEALIKLEDELKKKPIAA